MTNKKVLILGATGMLGHTLLLYLDKIENIKLIATARNVDKLAHNLLSAQSAKVVNNVDANNIDSLNNLITEIMPDVVINCIGIIKQLPISKDPIASLSLNALLPHQLAVVCHAIGSRLIHISTDCVFKGDRGNYTEHDTSDADDLYGRTKFLGEATGRDCVTLRTSIIGHELNSNYGLVDWFLSQEGRIRGFTNAIFSGFPTIELARIIADHVIPNEQLNGLYQVSSAPISKYDLLQLIAKQYNKQIKIEPFDDFYCDRSLNSSKFRKHTGYSPPPWEELVKAMHDDFLRRAGDKK